MQVYLLNKVYYSSILTLSLLPALSDFHFASILGPILLPETYGGRVLSPETKQYMVRAIARLDAESGRIKASPSGQFALSMYEKYRLL
jgi:hypothetical protein